MTRSPLVEYIVNNLHVLTQIDFAKEIFMVPERLEAASQDSDTFTIHTESPLYKGKLFPWDDQFFAIGEWTRYDDRRSNQKSYKVKANPTTIPYHQDESLPLCTPQDTFTLQKGDIPNYDGPPITTTIGRFIANYLFLVYPFDTVIPYINGEISTSTLEKNISLPLLDDRIKVQDVKDKYINTLSLFGQATEMFSPNITEKTIVIPPYINALREKLILQNKTALEAGDPTVMTDIENQLITEYKKHLQGDPSLHFLLKPKYFNVAFKKLLLVQGMTEIFGSPGKFTFVGNSLSQGWKVEDLPPIFNEVRSGSYSRAIETAHGGVIAKLILRVLQDTRITTDDCKTTRGETVKGIKEILQDLLWNYVINPDGSLTLISQETIPSLIGKDHLVRTPGYCQATKGFCAKCFGKVFEELGQKAFAPVANGFAREQTTSALKKMHGKSHNLADISDLNNYLI